MVEHTGESKPSRTMVVDRSNARVIARFGPDVIEPPSQATAFRELEELERHHPTFRLSTKRNRDIADRPDETYGKLRANRDRRRIRGRLARHAHAELNPDRRRCHRGRACPGDSASRYRGRPGRWCRRSPRRLCRNPCCGASPGRAAAASARLALWIPWLGCSWLFLHVIAGPLALRAGHTQADNLSVDVGCWGSCGRGGIPAPAGCALPSSTATYPDRCRTGWEFAWPPPMTPAVGRWHGSDMIDAGVHSSC